MALRAGRVRDGGFRFAVVLLGVGALAPAPSASEGSGQEVGAAVGAIVGLWELDPEESDDPAEVMAREAERAEEQRGRRGRPGGRAGRPAGTGREGAAGTGRGGGGAGLLSLPEVLEIESAEGEVRLLLEERTQILYLDGEEHAREDGRGGRITSVAELRGGIVRVREVRKLRRGEMRVFRTFQAVGDVLVVRTEFTPPRGGDPLLLRSVYRRIP